MMDPNFKRMRDKIDLLEGANKRQFELIEKLRRKDLAHSRLIAAMEAHIGPASSKAIRQALGIKVSLSDQL